MTDDLGLPTTPEERDKYENELIAAGAVWAALTFAEANNTRLRAEVVPHPDDPNVVTTSIYVWFPGFLKSRYRLTVKMDPEPGKESDGTEVEGPERSSVDPSRGDGS